MDDKVRYLEKSLNRKVENYAEGFRFDIMNCLCNLNVENSLLIFLNNLNTTDEIEAWITNLTSKIVLKFDEENEHINDFILDFLEF